MKSLLTDAVLSNSYAISQAVSALQHLAAWLVLLSLYADHVAQCGESHLHVTAACTLVLGNCHATGLLQFYESFADLCSVQQQSHKQASSRAVKSLLTDAGEAT